MLFKKIPLVKLLRYLLFIPAVIALFIAGFHFFVNRYLQPLLKRKLQEAVINGSDSLYRCSLDTPNIEFRRNRVTVKNFRMRVDSARYKAMKQAKTLPGIVVEADLSECAADGFELTSLLFSKKIVIREIVSKNASVRLYRYFKSSEEPSETQKSVPLWKRLQPGIKKIKIGNVVLDHVRLAYYNADSAKAFRWAYDDLSAAIKDIRIDSMNHTDTSRMLYARDVSFKIKGFRLKTSDGLYNLSAREASYSSFSNKADIIGLTLKPAVTKAAFYRQIGFEKDIFNLSFPAIHFSDLRLSRWFLNNELNADTVWFRQPVVDVYKDRTAPPDKRNKIGKYPHQLLQKAPFVIRIKTLNIRNGSIFFTEKNRDTRQEGKLSFQHVRGNISNITNRMGDLNANAVCTADLYSTFMQRSQLHSVFTFYLKSETGRFRVEADLKNLTADQLNPITVPLGKVRLESLQLHKLHYSLSADNAGSVGNVRMLYDNLEINMLKQQKQTRKMKNRGFLSFIANKLLIFPSNPHKDNEERRAQNIILQRDAHKGFFNIVWKTLFEGAKEVAVRKSVRDLMRKKDQKSKEKISYAPFAQFYAETQ